MRISLVAVALAVLLPAAARADLLTDLLALTEKSNDTKAAAVESLAAGGHERALPILEAYLDGRLFQVKVDDRLVIGEEAGKGYRISDAVT
ncbi:MAG TPA: urea ABC transporter permease subunit UrtB, partial [Kiloniellaceae bacterium]|nr:urea ABC transporter permease subunit UrtB [Kiloniellaceae bacterium]